MLGKDLIKWIQDNNAEDLPVSVQYRDDGGEYYGEDLVNNPMIICGKPGYSSGFYLDMPVFKRMFPGVCPEEIDDDYDGGDDEGVYYGGRRILL